MAAVLNSTQAARSAAGWRSATSTTSSGIATMRDSVSRFGRSVSIARTLAAWGSTAGGGESRTKVSITGAFSITTRLMPANVSTGISAFLNACIAIAANAGRPFSRASLMYSLRSTSSMLDRVSRSSDAAKYQPSASAGITRLRQPPGPLVGSHSSHTKNTSIITSPSQNPGTDRPSSTMVLPMWSHALLTRTAETMPAGMPITNALPIRRSSRPVSPSSS